MRKLASIQRIWKIEDMENADRLQKAFVEGWVVVVPKEQFKVMDLAVYFEIDSFLPVDPRFEFLRTTSYKKTDMMGEGFKLRTLKLRGQISQGLLLPLSEFPEIENPEIGQDVTTLLGVKKWEIEEKATTGGNVVGGLPYDVPHTDESRVQNHPELIDEFGDQEYYISTKMDGSSHSISMDGNGFHVCGHNYEYKNDGSSSFYNFVNERGYQQRIEDYFCKNELSEFTLQGEFCAPGIQRNRLRLVKPEWYVFTVRINGERIGMDEMLSVCESLRIPHVPIEERGTGFKNKYPTVEAVLARADGEYPNGGPKEGVVIRTVKPVYSSTIGDYLSMKAVSNKYLLKNGE